jgi:hypothetical protein
MGDSHHEDPHEGWSVQRVVTGIISFGSGGRHSSAAARRRSASVSTTATLPNNINNNNTVSFSVARSIDRPDPDAPRAETLQVSHHNLLEDDARDHPNVETHRGHYDGSFSILPSISGTIQRQIHHLEDAFEAAMLSPVNVPYNDVHPSILPPPDRNPSEGYPADQRSSDHCPTGPRPSSFPSTDHRLATSRLSVAPPDARPSFDRRPSPDHSLATSRLSVAPPDARPSFDRRPSLDPPQFLSADLRSAGSPLAASMAPPRHIECHPSDTPVSFDEYEHDNETYYDTEPPLTMITTMPLTPQ